MPIIDLYGGKDCIRRVANNFNMENVTKRGSCINSLNIVGIKVVFIPQGCNLQFFLFSWDFSAFYVG